MKSKNLISIYDLTAPEVEEILKWSKTLKTKHSKGIEFKPLKGKTMACIFQKPSLRTRVSFEVGIYQLGGSSIYLGPEDIKLGKRESTADIARTLSRYVDVIMARTFEHEIVTELAKYSSVPVINGLSDLEHPCQALADLFTVSEKKPKLKGLKLAFFGDGNNVAHSLLLTCAKAGMNMSLSIAHGFEPNEKIVKLAKEEAKKTKSEIAITYNPKEAAKNADVLYTDVWASMGQEAEAETRKKAMMPYQINNSLLKLAKQDCLIMHCLPAHRGEEITEEVIEGKNSAVFDQAENRLHTQKAILCLILM